MTISETVRLLMLERLTLSQRLDEIDTQLKDVHQMIGVEARVEGDYNQSQPVIRETGVTKEQVLKALTRPMRTAEIGDIVGKGVVTVRPYLYELLRDGLVAVSGRTNGRLWSRVARNGVKHAMPALPPVDADDEPFESLLPAEVRSRLKPVEIRCFGPGFDPRRAPCPDGALVDGNITRRCPSCAKQHHGPRTREVVEVVFDGTANSPLQSLLSGAEYGPSSLSKNG